MNDEVNLINEKVPFSSRLPAKLRTDFEIEARKRGIRVIEVALQQAIEAWIGAPPVTGPENGLGKLSPAEERRLARLRDLIRRDDPADELGLAVIDAVLNKARPKR